MQNKIILSGIQPSGDLHIGNYLGAIKQWVELQKSHRVFVIIVDLHAITVPQDPEKLHAKTLETAALLLACGIDPKKSVLFIQDRKSTRLNSSHSSISYAVFCLKKKI